MVAPQPTTAQQTYDPENKGAWTGQLPNPDLVGQLPAPIERKPGGPLDRDEWRRSNAARLGHAAYKLLDILSGYSNPEGRCYPGMDLLAHDTGMSARALRRGLAELLRHQLVWPTFPGCTVSRAHPYQLAGGLDGWDCAESGTTIVPKVAQFVAQIVPKVAHRTLLLQNPKINPKDPGAVDTKRGAHPGPEGGGTTGVEFFSLEEERTGTGDYQVYQDFVNGQLSEIPTDSEMEPLAKHCWPEWKKHWGGGWAAAWPTWTKDTAGRKKFRSDVVAQLQKVGLPKPLPPDPENDLARERAAAWLDQRLEEAPKRMMDVKCAGCGFPRQLPPGQTHCYSCRNLAEAPKLAKRDYPTVRTADEYEKLIEENIRRYREADGLAPEDAKVEAVGAALD